VDRDDEVQAGEDRREPHDDTPSAADMTWVLENMLLYGV